MAPPAILIEEITTIFDDYFDFILSQYAYGLSGFGGRLNVPSIRGVNSQSPMGADRFRPHWYGPRQEQWSMFVSSNVPATDLPGGRAQAMANLDAVKAAFLGNLGLPFQCERNVRLPGVTDLTFRAAEAVCKGLSVETTAGGALHRVTVDVEIPTGLWTSESFSPTISGTGVTVLTGSASVVPDSIELGGTCSVFNDTTGTGFTYAGGACIYYPAQWKTDDGTSIADLTPTSLLPITFRPGSNHVTFSGTGITVNYTEAWL